MAGNEARSMTSIRRVSWNALRPFPLAIIFLIACIFVGTQQISAQHNDPSNWSFSDSSASLLVIVDGEVNGFIFSLQADGQIIDQTKWSTDLPYVRQFRLPPGEYTVSSSNGSDSVQLSLSAGTMSYVVYQIASRENPEAILKTAGDNTRQYDVQELLTQPDIGLVLSRWNDALINTGYAPWDFWAVQYVEPSSNFLTLVPNRRPPPPEE